MKYIQYDDCTIMSAVSTPSRTLVVFQKIQPPRVAMFWMTIVAVCIYTPSRTFVVSTEAGGGYQSRCYSQS